MKVIQIMHHSLSPINSNTDIRFDESDWHTKIAKQILKRTKKYGIECWRPERTFRREYTRREGEITYKIFPSVHLRFGREYSISLLKELRKQSKEEDILVHIHGIHNHLAYLISYSFKNVPIVAQHHGSKPALYNFRRSNNPLRFLCLLEYYPEKIALKDIDYFFVLTKYEKKFLSNLVGADKVEIQTVGVDFDIFKPMNKEKAKTNLSLDGDNRYILYVGYLTKSKGLDYLLEALPKIIVKYPNTVLLLAGQGNYKSNLTRLAKNLGILNNIMFLGYINNNQLPLFYNASDLFILPSLSEGAPVTCIEAMACGVPVIGTKVGGIPDIMDNFKTGLLIQPKDREAIGEAVLTVLNDPNSFKVDRNNGKKYYDWKNIIKNTIKVYEELFSAYYDRYNPK